MKLTFDDPDQGEDWDWAYWRDFGDGNEELPLYFVFASEDLSEFCTSVLRLKRETATSQPLNIIIYPHVESKMRHILNPIQQLHSMDTVEIDGLSDETFRNELIHSMCGPPECDREVVEKISQAINNGDAVRKFDLPLAVVRYTTGLNGILCSNLLNPQSYIAWALDESTRSPFLKITQNFIFSLYTRLAESHLELGKLRHARIYAERVYELSSGACNRSSSKKIPLQVDDDKKSLYASAMLVGARISFIHENLLKASEEIAEAIRLGAPYDSHRPLYNAIQERRKL